MLAAGPKELVWIETHNPIELDDPDQYVSIAAADALWWLRQVPGMIILAIYLTGLLQSRQGRYPVLFSKTANRHHI